MKVTVSAPGRYWAFDLARQLQERNCLARLITGYPRFEVKKHGLPPGKIVSLPLNQLIYRGWAGLPPRLRVLYDPILLVTELFDRQARRRIRDCDIFVGWAGFCLRSLREARRRGAVILVERGSSHMLFQQEIMREEYERCGVAGPLAHPGIIERELREYDEADYIVVPSLFARRTFLERGVAGEKLFHNPFGVDLDQFRPGKKEDDIFRVVFAGGIGLRKGVHYLLRAFAEVKLPRSELLLIGPVQEEIKPFFRRYEGTFTWIGPRPQGMLSGDFSSGSVFVLPSIEDGFGLVLIQAAACGLPLVASTNTGGEDLIEEGKQGFIIPIRDVEALKEKLLYLYRRPEECREMGRSAETRVRSGFTWDDYGRRTLENYRRILKER